MEWVAILNGRGLPAMKVGEEVLVACHAAHNRDLRCVLMGRLRKVPGARGPFGPDLILESTWDGKPVEELLVPYAFGRPNPPEPK